jgi:hypothetical protein
MDETKYEKYFVRNALGKSGYPPFTPRMLFDAKKHFPEILKRLSGDILPACADMENLCLKLKRLEKLRFLFNASFASHIRGSIS